MKQADPKFDPEREEGARQSESTLSVLMWVSWAAYLVVIIAGLFWGDWPLVTTILISGIVLVVPFWLLKRGYYFASGLILVMTVLFTVTAVATFGQGYHDVAIIAYPVILIYASLALNRVSFRITVLLTFAAMAWLVFGEKNGLFVPQPIEPPTWIDFLAVAAIIFAAILVIGLVSTNMRKNLDLARSEIIKRNQANEALREKEVQYRTLADSGIALIWMSGTDKLCHYFNLPWMKFTGRTLEQELGNGWTEGVHPDDFDRCLATYITAFDKHEPFDMDYRLRHVSGEFRWIRDLGTPNYNSNGEFIGYIGHCFDITARIKAEAALRQNQSMLARTERIAQIGSWEWDVATDRVTWSDELFRIFQRNPADGAPSFAEHSELYQPDDLLRLKEAVEAALSTGKPYELELRAIPKDGSARVCLARGYVEKSSEKGARRLFGSLQDITGRKQAEIELRES